MTLDLSLRLKEDERGLISKYRPKNRKTVFTLGLLSVDKDWKFDDPKLEIEQPGIGKFTLLLHDSKIDEFELSLKHPEKRQDQ